MMPVHQRHLAVRLMLSSRRLIKVNPVTLIGRHIFFDHSLENGMIAWWKVSEDHVPHHSGRGQFARLLPDSSSAIVRRFDYAFI
jgi:hypothetical protein